MIPNQVEVMKTPPKDQILIYTTVSPCGAS